MVRAGINFQRRKIPRARFLSRVKTLLEHSVGAHFKCFDWQHARGKSTQIGGFWGGLRLLLPVVDAPADVLVRRGRQDRRKKEMKGFLVALVFALILLPAVAKALEGEPSASLAAENWVIESFHAKITIHQNGKVRVVETIVADFGLTRKHGIYRTVDTTEMKFKLLGVKQDGEKAITKVSSVSDGKRIRIGDPDKTITGRHTYEIVYEVGGVITRFDDYDEFYWDVTGTGWTVPINKAVADVSLEGKSQLGDTACYTGAFGEREEDCYALMEAGVAHFETTAPLLPGSGLTIVYGFSKGLIGDPFYPEDFLKTLWMVVASLAAVIFMLRLWWKHGRDMWYRKVIILNPEAKAEMKPLFTKGTIVVQFDPPKVGNPSRELRPAEVGTLIDERIDVNDVSATIVDLAVRGYLRIHEDKVGRRRIYSFERLTDYEKDASLAGWELAVLRGLFERGNNVRLDDLKERFYKHLGGIRNELYRKMTFEEKLFAQRPDKVKSKYIKLGITTLAAFLILTSATAGTLLWLLLPSAVLGFLMLVMSPLMPKKTAMGTEMVRQASGFKLFISKAEKYRQQFNERINRFDQFLPYAMVFGVVDKWVGTFKVLGVEPLPPSWYVAPYAFSASDFSSSLRGVGRALASTLPSTPASTGGGSGFGGGGFSGGGFGGGGGGGW